MAISSKGYPDQISGVETVDSIDWSKIWEHAGHIPIVESGGHLAGTGATGRMVNVAAGTASGKGILDVLTGSTPVGPFPAASGTRYYAVLVRRNWDTGRTTLGFLGGGTTATLPGGLNNSPGVSHDTPLHLWRVISGDEVPVLIEDYRVTRAQADSPLVVRSNIREKPDTQYVDTQANGFLWETMTGLDLVYVAGNWTYGSGVWTIPTDGVWTASATVHHDAANTGTVGIRFVCSGTVVAQDTRANNNNAATVNVAGTFYATAGQTVTVQAWASDPDGQHMGASAGGAPARYALTAVVPSY